MTKTSLKQRFIQFVVSFTYRQRFIFWILICLLSVPLPAYWVIRTQEFFISRSTGQLQGNRVVKYWFELLDAVLGGYIDWANNSVGDTDEGNGEIGIVLRPIDQLLNDLKLNYANLAPMFVDRGLFRKSPVETKAQSYIDTFEGVWREIENVEETADYGITNKHYLDAISQLITGIHTVAVDYRMVLQTSTWMNELTKAVFFSLPQNLTYLVDVYVSALHLSKQNAPSKILLDEVNLKLDRFKRNLVRTKQLLESAYSMLLENGYTNHSTYAEVREQLLDSFRWNTHFIEVLEEALHPIKGPIKSVDATKAHVALGNLIKLRDDTNKVLVQLIADEKIKYQRQRNLVMGVLSFFVLSLLATLIFKLLTGHFNLILNYIQGVAKGDFSLPIYVNSKEETGQITMAFQKMGQSIQQLVLQLQTLSKNLGGSISQLIKTADEQAEVVEMQKNSLERLETTTRQIVEKSRDLADTMNTFTLGYKRQQIENTSGQRAAAMQNKMQLLTQASANILNVLNDAQKKVFSTDTLVNFMTRVSSRAATLSLNAAIEVITLGQHKQMFSDITGKIHRFAELTSTSTESIQKIVNEMSQSLSSGQKTAKNCLNDISNGAESLLSVIKQLETIASQDEQQAMNFQLVNEMMQKLAKVSGEIIVSLNSLSDTVKDNTESVKELYKTIGELGETANELQHVLHELFNTDQTENKYS